MTTSQKHQALQDALQQKREAQAYAQAQRIAALMPALLTTDQAAEFIGIKPDTLYRWRKEGRGPAFVKSRGFVRYTAEALNQWIAAGGDVSQKLGA